MQRSAIGVLGNETRPLRSTRDTQLNQEYGCSIEAFNYSGAQVGVLGTGTFGPRSQRDMQLNDEYGCPSANEAYRPGRRENYFSRAMTGIVGPTGPNPTGPNMMMYGRERYMAPGCLSSGCGSVADSVESSVGCYNCSGTSGGGSPIGAPKNGCASGYARTSDNPFNPWNQLAKYNPLR